MMFEKQTIHIGAWCTLERNHHCQQITNAHERKYDGNMRGNMEVDGNLRRNIEVICNSFATNLICDSAMASNLLGSKIMVVLKDLRQNVLFNGIPRQSSLFFQIHVRAECGVSGFQIQENVFQHSIRLSGLVGFQVGNVNLILVPPQVS